MALAPRSRLFRSAFLIASRPPGAHADASSWQESEINVTRTTSFEKDPGRKVQPAVLKILSDILQVVQRKSTFPSSLTNCPIRGFLCPPIRSQTDDDPTEKIASSARSLQKIIRGYRSVPLHLCHPGDSRQCGLKCQRYDSRRQLSYR